ncbi:hypothetical protein ACFO4N_13520 [Camelliibacillus cellulosilyticus]|uniref:C1q domain-containing protein n=1 Tax=Camelliibacillus cellulosilyticus TaxID=2174486 RepID=A0ABV9GR01_9BACL
MESKLSLFEDSCSERNKRPIFKINKSGCAGVVTDSSTITIDASSFPNTDPLLSPVLKTDCVRVSPTGGLFVEEEGDYLVTYSARGFSVAQPGATLIITVFAGSKFLGNVVMPSRISLNFVNFTKIAHLKKGDEVYVLVNQTAALFQGTLTVAKLNSKKTSSEANPVGETHGKINRKEKSRDNETCVGVVGFNTNPFFTFFPTPLIIFPLSTSILVTDCVRTSPKGGIIVEEEGVYLIEFTGFLRGFGNVSIYANSEHLGDIQLRGDTIVLSTFSKIARLKKETTVFAFYNGPAITFLGGGTLTAAKLK